MPAAHADIRASEAQRMFMRAGDARAVMAPRATRDAAGAAATMLSRHDDYNNT